MARSKNKNSNGVAVKERVMLALEDKIKVIDYLRNHPEYEGQFTSGQVAAKIHNDLGITRCTDANVRACMKAIGWDTKAGRSVARSGSVTASDVRTIVRQIATHTNKHTEDFIDLAVRCGAMDAD